MITINKENLDETRVERRNSAGDSWPFDDILGTAPTSEGQADKDSTQRLSVDESISKMPPIRRSTPSRQPRPAAPAQRRTAEAAPQRKSAPNRSASAAAKKKQEKTTIIILIALAVILAASIITILIVTLNPSSDDGKIFNKVFAAGVDLSGMTKEQAKVALRSATAETYSQLDMTVQVLDTVVTLSPTKTGARLNIDAVVEAAYAYGRDIPKNGGNAAYTVDILPHLSLDTGYIQEEVAKLGKRYSTILSETTYEVVGIRPDMNPDPTTVDTTRVFQTLKIHLGNAEYGLNTDRLYEQIIDAYNINLFQVTGECSVRAPETLDWEAIFAELCVKPQDATIDPNTYLITPEVYGYGFTMNRLNSALSQANYGETLEIPMCYLEPDITTAMLSGDLFKDILATYQTPLSGSANWNTNLQLVCKLLNGAIVKSGDTFSFNNLIGEPTEQRGFLPVDVYIGKSLTSVLGGGMSQVATTLYNCALLADLPIAERNAHTYAPSFVATGLDAQVYYGSMDFRFTNNTEQPLRIEATVADGQVRISLVGTNSKTYTVEISTQITATKRPGTDYITLPEDPLGMYADGDVLTEGITGYTVSVYKISYDTVTGRELTEDLVAETTYAKRNSVVIKVEATVPDVSDPTEPEVTEPETTIPSDTGTNE